MSMKAVHALATLVIGVTAALLYRRGAVAGTPTTT